MWITFARIYRKEIPNRKWVGGVTIINPEPGVERLGAVIGGWGVV